MPGSAPFHLRTLGELRLVGPGGDILAGRRKELLLLTYLARKSPRPVSRAELSALLWGERDEAKARQSLRHALYQLRQALGDAITVDNDSVVLPEGVVEWDVAAIERDVAASRFADAAERWQGELLPGAEDSGDEWFVSWLEGEREAIRLHAREAFARCVGAAREGSDADGELRQAKRWAEAFPLDSTAGSRLVEALIRNGDFADARRAWSAHQSVLKRELDETGPVEFLRLGQELDRLEQRSAERHPGSSAFLTPDLVGRDTILASLMQLWSQLDGTRAVVVVEGEEGMGKSRLCAELARQVIAAGGSARKLDPSAAGWESTAAGPALLLIDDTEGADAAARERLLAFIRDLPPSTMVVLTRRPDGWPELGRALDLGMVRGARRIKLVPLSTREVGQLLDSMLEIAPDDRAPLAQRLAADSGGNPFYVMELASALADAGVLVLLPSGRWQLDPALTSRTVPVPPTLRAAIRVRISQLGESARAVLYRCATSPQPVDARVVSLRAEGRLTGTLQATITSETIGSVAEIAWVIGTGWQGRGIAT
ncbi:MAG TPA: BTAD domain-containing putative transcriptional regulator, partial [Gemmatimonadales bacterium]|nr:BTAD domain-containing putative transcriptional regulator [Gemmatimonadales bacterium]